MGIYYSEEHYNKLKEENEILKKKLKIGSQLKECIENAINDWHDKNAENFNSVYELDNKRYDELLTRVQHFYDIICDKMSSNHADRNIQYEYEVTRDHMNEVFADFIYIPED